MRIIIFCSFLLGFIFSAQAQTDSTQSEDLLSELSASNQDTVELLPPKFLFTQHVLWGKHGLMRHTKRFELTPENRAYELRVRRFWLKSHQIIGFATLGGMIAQGIVGWKLYNGDESLLSTHQAIGAGVNIGYFTTASLSLFAPPKMVSERKGFSSIKLHKYLAIVHLSAMIATNVLAGSNDSLHRAAALTAFGAYAASIIAIKF